MSSNALKILREAGLLEFAKRSSGYVYRRTVRRLLPVVGPVRYSGIEISKDRKWGDLFIPTFMAPFMGQDIPNYEGVLVEALRTYVRAGDNVVVVGGGEGVTVAVSAQAAGRDGTVICFEGNEDCANNVRTAAKRNGVAEQVKVHHAIVGKDVNVYRT